MASIIWLTEILYNYGLLVFFLVFTIIFAVLQKSEILGSGDEKRKYNVVVALVLGLIVIIPHVLGLYPPGSNIVEIINNSIPSVSVIVVAIIMLLLIIGVFGNKLTLGSNTISGWIAVIAFLIVVYIFGAAAGWFSGAEWMNAISDDTWALIIIILIFAILIWFITKSDNGSDALGIGKKISELIKGD